MYSPILMSDVVSVPVNGKVQPLTDHFQNPFRTPMLIDEIRMGYENTNQSEIDPFSLQFRFSLGRDPLTADFIPAPMLGKLLNPGVDGTTLAPLVYTWKFPKPVYVPATEILVPTIFNNPMPGQGATASVRLTYVGRSLDPNYKQPTNIAVPFVALWMGLERTIGTDGSNLTDDSTESNLVNPFDKPLYVQRLIGRIRGGPDVANDGQLNPDTGDVLDNDQGAIVAQSLTLIQMTDSMGRQAVRDPTPFNNVFSAIDRAWTINTMLAPKGYYGLHLEENWLTAANFNFATAQPMVSMIGYRAVQLQG